MRGFQKGITLGVRTSGSVRKVFGGWVVACWNIESLCLPTEVLRDLYVTLTLLVKVKVTIKVTVKETGVSRETGCDKYRQLKQDYTSSKISQKPEQQSVLLRVKSDLA